MWRIDATTKRQASWKHRRWTGARNLTPKQSSSLGACELPSIFWIPAHIRCLFAVHHTYSALFIFMFRLLEMASGFKCECLLQVQWFNPDSVKLQNTWIKMFSAPWGSSVRWKWQLIDYEWLIKRKIMLQQQAKRQKYSIFPASNSKKMSGII